MGVCTRLIDSRKSPMVYILLIRLYLNDFIELIFTDEIIMKLSQRKLGIFLHA